MVSNAFFVEIQLLFAVGIKIAGCCTRERCQILVSHHRPFRKLIIVHQTIHRKISGWYTLFEYSIAWHFIYFFARVKKSIFLKFYLWFLEDVMCGWLFDAANYFEVNSHHCSTWNTDHTSGWCDYHSPTFNNIMLDD